MKLAKRVLMCAGAVALAGAFLNAVAPKTVHAAVAALVQVTNTATNPALTSRIDDPGRIPYEAGFYPHCSGTQCVVLSGTVPVNHRLVIEHVSVFLQFTSSPAEVDGDIENQSALQLAAYFVPVNGTKAVVDQPVRAYFDQSQSVRMTFNSTVSFAPFPAAQAVFLSGYLLDCNAAPCSAIASF